MSHIQMLGGLGIFKAKGTKVFSEWVLIPSAVAGGSITSALAVKCVLGSQIYAPFILNMALPPAGLGIAGLLMIPTAVIERCVRRKRRQGSAPVFKGKFNIPRCLAPFNCMRAAMSPADIKEWGSEYFPLKRLAGVATFLLFFLCVYYTRTRAHARRRSFAP